MVIRELQTSIERVDKIFHIGDIHIRNRIRHAEYRAVFENLANEIKRRATENSIIYVAGDIVHSKSEISPELVDMLSVFFKTLLDICPTVVILGNHDTNLNNTSRLDAISPVVDLLNSPNLYFLRENGYYKFAQIGFNVLEVSTQPVDFLKGEGLDCEVKIALHHGAVNLARTDLNARIGNDEVSTGTFDGHDLALLGDIHLQQFLQYRYEEGNKVYPTIAYCGSLIQQNHGEKITGHGMLVWNLSDFSVEQVDITNEYGYYTLEVEEGNIINWDEAILPLRPILRVKFKDTAIADQKIIETYVRSKRKVAGWAPYSTKSQASAVSSLDRMHTLNVRDVEFQNKLIEQYFDQQKIPNPTLDLIRHLNRITNSKLGTTHKSDTLRNITWEPVSFAFSNMFSYGKGNFVDFTNLDGIYGIFGPNKIGKSTLFDSICFCLFDKCSKTNKAKDVLNKSEKAFECKFTFKINNLVYTVEKRGSTGRTGNVKVEIDFYVTDASGTVTSLNGDQRDSTTKNIRNYVGSYEDFTLTALSVQNNGTNFIEKPQRERRELLVNFLDIGVFEELYSIAAESLNESGLKWKVKSYENENYPEKITSAALKVGELNRTHDQILIDITAEQSRQDFLDNERQQLINSITSVETDLDVKALKNKLDLLEKKKSKLVQLIATEEVAIRELNVIVSDNKVDDDILQQLIEKDEYRTELQSRASLIQSGIKEVKLKVDHFSAISRHLETYEYDPNCKYCVQAPTVEQGLAARVELSKLGDKMAALEVQHTEVVNELKNYITVLTDLEALRKKKSLLEKTTATLKLKERELSLHVKELSLLGEEESQVLKDITKASEYEERQEQNTQIQLSIQEVEKLLTQSKKNLTQLLTRKSEVGSQILTQQRLIEDFTIKLQDFEQIRSEYDAYTLYMQAIKTDGIPYRLTNDILPGIEEEVNLLLAGVVDFKVVLETDNKNINAYIMYDGNIGWPVESGSGMEKFVSSLAIRNALIVNTSLPKPNIVCIDEGFGVLDEENLAGINVLLQKMKENFKTLFCISHIRDVKDVVDYPMYVTRVNSNSFINI